MICKWLLQYNFQIGYNYCKIGIFCANSTSSLVLNTVKPVIMSLEYADIEYTVTQSQMIRDYWVPCALNGKAVTEILNLSDLSTGLHTSIQPK